MNVYYTHAPVEGPHYASKNAAIAVSGAAYRWRQGKGGVYLLRFVFDDLSVIGNIYSAVPTNLHKT